MKTKIKLLRLLVILLCLFNLNGHSQTAYNQQWPGFRGPWTCGFIDHVKTATTWNAESNENIKWKTAIPGLGHSSPVIWDNYLFVTTAVNTVKSESLKVGLYGDIDEANDSAVHEFKVYCLDKNSGKIIWERLAHKGIPKSKRHTKASQANCTPATDGKLYFSSEDGNIYVLQAGPEFKLLAKNPLKDICMATPAISVNTLFFRTQHYVIAVE
jgi:outer membrane protein assembly factor BamB